MTELAVPAKRNTSIVTLLYLIFLFFGQGPKAKGAKERALPSHITNKE